MVYNDSMAHSMLYNVQCMEYYDIGLHNVKMLYPIR